MTGGSLVLWAALTFDWGGAWTVQAGPTVSAYHYDLERAVYTREAAVSPCVVTVDADGVAFESRLEASILAWAP